MFTLGRLTLYAAAVVLSASLVEAWVLSRKRPGEFDWGEVGLSLVDLFGRKLLSLIPFSLAAPLFAFAWDHRLFTVTIHSGLAGLLLFLGQELCYYWYHRSAHRMRFFWATHSVHHSPNQLTLSSAYRLGWTGKLAGAAMFFTPLVWLGVQPKVVLAVFSINLLYQFWIHATWIPRLGWLEYVLNTPSAHRVHHASNLEYLDANYGGVLIIFDRLFGTYTREQDDNPCRYGLVTPVRTRNPLVLEFQQWIELGRDVLSAKTPWAALGYLVRPPGWRPDGASQSTEDLRREAQCRETEMAGIGRGLLDSKARN